MPNELSILHMLMLAQLADLGQMTPVELGRLVGIDAEVAEALCRDLEEAGMIERTRIACRRRDRRD